MKKATKINLVLLALTLSANGLYAQQGFGTTTPNKSSVIDMTSSTKGVLVPRVALINTTDFQPITGIGATNLHTANSLLVYNTASNGSGTTAVSPGYYYWEKPNAGIAGKWVRLADSNAAYIEPWQVQGTADKATNNTQNIYQAGKVAVGFTESDPISSKQFEIKGDFLAKTPIAIDGMFHTLGTNIGGNTVTGLFTQNLLTTSPSTMSSGSYSLYSPFISVMQTGTPASSGVVASMVNMAIGNQATTNILANSEAGKYVSLEMRSTAGESTNFGKLVSTDLVEETEGQLYIDNNYSQLEHSNIGSGTDKSSKIRVNKDSGVEFYFGNKTGNSPTGNYRFPQTNGNANQVLTTNGVNGTANLTWTDISSLADVRRIGTNHISEDAGLGGNGSAMPGNFNIAIGGGAMGHANPVGVSGSLGLAGNIAVGGGNQLDRINSAGSVAIGYGNLPVATTGQNVAIGPLNLTAVTTGNSNMSVGINNAPALTTGNGNITMGSVNLTALTEGGANFAIGNESLKKITTQEQNIAIGNNVLKNIAGTNNDKNIGVGHDILTVLTNGKDNVGFGTASGGALTTGSYNTFFGTEAGNRLLGSDAEIVKYKEGSYSLFLGSQTKAKNTGDSQLNIGNWIYGENGNIALGNFNNSTALPTITSTTRLDVVSGNVRVRDINLPASTGAVADRSVVADSNGVLKTVKQAPRFFYMPSVIFNTAVSGADLKRDLYNDYLNQFTGQPYGVVHGAGGLNGQYTLPYTGGLIRSGVGTASEAPNAISVYAANELYYYITYYDQAVFRNVRIDANGILTYDIIGSSSDASYMNIVFVVKE